MRRKYIMTFLLTFVSFSVFCDHGGYNVYIFHPHVEWATLWEDIINLHDLDFADWYTQDNV
jgi:hypothetical protein